MAAEIIPTQIFILILVIILAAVVVVIISQWRKVSQSNNSLKLLEKEIELIDTYAEHTRRQKVTQLVDGHQQRQCKYKLQCLNQY